MLSADLHSWELVVLLFRVSEVRQLRFYIFNLRSHGNFRVVK